MPDDETPAEEVFDVLEDLDRLWETSSVIDGPPLNRGAVAAITLLAHGEITRLRGWLAYIEGDFRDARDCAREALAGDDAPEGFDP